MQTKAAEQTQTPACQGRKAMGKDAAAARSHRREFEEEKVTSAGRPPPARDESAATARDGAAVTAHTDASHNREDEIETSVIWNSVIAPIPALPVGAHGNLAGIEQCRGDLEYRLHRAADGSRNGAVCRAVLLTQQFSDAGAFGFGEEGAAHLFFVLVRQQHEDRNGEQRTDDERDEGDGGQHPTHSSTARHTIAARTANASASNDAARRSTTAQSRQVPSLASGSRQEGQRSRTAL